MAVRMPASETVATPGSDDCQETPLVTTCFPLVVVAEAVSSLVCPVGMTAGPTTSSALTVLGTTDTTSVPAAIWSLAVMIVAPSAIAVTRPVAETVATLGFDDCHAAVFVTSCDADADCRSMAESWPTWPTVKVSPPVKEMDGVNVVAEDAVVGELEQAAEQRSTRIAAGTREEKGIAAARARTLPSAPRAASQGDQQLAAAGLRDLYGPSSCVDTTCTQLRSPRDAMIAR